MAYIEARQETPEGLLQSAINGLNSFLNRTHKDAAVFGDDGSTQGLLHHGWLPDCGLPHHGRHRWRHRSSSFLRT